MRLLDRDPTMVSSRCILVHVSIATTQYPGKPAHPVTVTVVVPSVSISNARDKASDGHPPPPGPSCPSTNKSA